MSWLAALVTILVAVIGAASAIVSAVVTSRTRSENSEQHARGQQAIANLATAQAATTAQVGSLTFAVDGLSDRVGHVERKVDSIVRSSAPAILEP